MIGATATTQMHPEKVTKAVDRSTFKNLGHAAARISKDAKASLERAEGPSAPGTPPHTHRGAYLRRAIRFDNDRKAQEAVIGPMESIVGTAGSAHEHGGEYKGQTFPERPFMVPALEQNLDRFASEWAGSIGE
jgi:hypothetical protein